jgi:hypothetical protein
MRDVSGASEKVLHSLAGATDYITKGEVLERFEKAKIIAPKDEEKLFDYMLWYGVLGVVNERASSSGRCRCQGAFVLPDGVRFTSKPWSRKDVLELARAAVAEQ